MPTIEDIYAKIDEIQADLIELETMVGAYDAYDSDDDDEPVEVTKILEIIAGKANARCVRTYNAAGRPVMMIYPEDSAPVKYRVQYTLGTYIQVNPTIVKGDGGYKYYSIAEEVKKNGVVVTTPLFIREQDGALQV